MFSNFNCNYEIYPHFCVNFIYISHFENDFCVMFIFYISLFICFPSLSFSFKLCVQLCDDVCGVQVVNYSMDCSCKMNNIILNPNGQ